jgi:phosphoglycerol transferase MdoB-like AlkP superfamily enzyme
MNKKIRWILLTLLTYFTVMTAGRLFLLFTSGYLHGISKNLFKALWLGTRYDLRELGILTVLMVVIPLVPFLDPFKTSFAKKFWICLLSVLSVAVVFMYVIDAMHFDYLAQRLNASILNFIPEGSTSSLMVWQTYPVIKILLLIALLSALIIFFIRKVFKIAGRETVTVNKRSVTVTNVILFLLAALCVFGRIGQYPLRWSDAFELGDSRLSQLALNPIQCFFSSMSFRHVSYDEAASRKYYPLMASYLGVDATSAGNLSFIRKVAGKGTNKPNVVLVICESFSAYKSSMWGNPLNTTPYFRSLCDSGIFFDRCFTPHFGTARGVWATMTGIPDVLLDKTASRDPLIVDQHTIMNDFAGYEKDYFIGGSTSWANIKGVLNNNIEGITIHEQGNYNAEKVDVWGISDKNLFLQANEVLLRKTTPFFTIIQTSDNHRPYTIPKEDKEAFKTVHYPADSLIKYGFQSNDELNAFRYTDFCFQTFMETAKKEKYFNNTIFVFIGDHGIRGNAGNMFPKAWTNNALTCFHVPLLFYSPALLQHARHTMICSQVDVLPTIAGIAGISYTNATMGRDLLHLNDTTSNTAFLIDHDIRNIAVVHGAYMFQHQLMNNQEALVSINDNEPIQKGKYNSISDEMRTLTIGFFEISKYMLFNNAKPAHK